jgi:D-alanyl-D-alanine dipeptidase
MIGFDRPIPIAKRAPTAADYHDVPVDSEDPRYREALVNAREWGLAGENYYSRTDGRNPPYRKAIDGAIRGLWCRQTIVTMLVKVNERLAEHGVELFLWDAYRPIACQRALWEFFRERARREMPEVDENKRSEHARRYVSDPTLFDPADPRTWPVHTTGGAIDLTLRNARTRELLDMGAAFDEMRETSHTAHFEQLLKSGAIGRDDHRLRNRRMLYWAMLEQGFTNYTYEYWHFDFGDQMYVMERKRSGRCAAAAWYGYAPPPAEGTA